MKDFKIKVWFILITVTLFCTAISCNKNFEKNFICENLPEALWGEEVFSTANNILADFSEFIEGYAENQITQYYGTFYDIFGFVTDDYHAYIARYNEVISTISDDFSALLSLPMNYDYNVPTITDTEAATRLLGTPKNISKISAEEQREVARLMICNALAKIQKPSILSCEYNKKIKLWEAIMQNGNRYYVKIIEGDDDSIYGQYSNQLDNGQLKDPKLIATYEGEYAETGTESSENSKEEEVREAVIAIYDDIFNKYCLDPDAYLTTKFRKDIEAYQDKCDDEGYIGIEYNWWSQGQDEKNPKAQVGKATIVDKNKATVEVRVDPFGDNMAKDGHDVVLVVIKEDGEWKVDDFIDKNGNTSLHKTVLENN